MTIQIIPFVLLLLTFLLELGGEGVTISGCIANERNALLNFKKNLNNTNNRLVSWNGEDCCNWKGVSCNNLTGHVVRLDLRNPHPFSDEDDIFYNEWSLRGPLSPSLLCLKELNYLDLSMNLFDGPIPKFIGSLRNLRYLNLSLAGFHGLIPHHLGNLSRLESLDLNIDLISYREAIIDDPHWISGLTMLEHLTMKKTNFKSFQNLMEALNKLPNIAELCISNCFIHGFPVSLPYVNFTKLSYLDLSNNDISQGIIPVWLFDIKSLTHIDLSSNNWNSSIPEALENLTSLQYIDFSYNYFSGALPQALKKLCKLHTLRLRRALTGRDMHEFREMFSGCLKDSIENLDLSLNNLNGSLPDLFGEMHKLKTLYLMDNLLSGPIPESLGHLAALEELHLSQNKLNGTVPKSIGQLSNLVLLYLGENSLEGVICEVHFTRLAKLKELNIQSNNLILNVSRDWIPPFKLIVIRMGYCKIGPHFPRWLETQVNISYLNLTSSQIVDDLPDWFWDVFVTHDVSTVTLDLSNNGITGYLPPLSKLTFFIFDVSNNSFSGSIQPVFGGRTLEGTGILTLSRNNFSGEIPLSICLANVMWIDLSWNTLTGRLPNCWNPRVYTEDGWPRHFDFSGNNLYGNISHSLGTLTVLQSLHLSHNNLSGSLPMILRNCVSLITLDLSMNSLTGIIPTWVGEDLTNLRVLILRSNNFMGNVPSNLSNLTQLQILDLANNKLTGRIPWSFGNFSVMMDGPSFSEDLLLNFYLGMLPIIDLREYVQLIIKKRLLFTYDRLLTQITIIDLSSNNLSEQIPIELGNLHGLIFLNLSGNHLVGPIPDAIGSMHFLESLDLSRNELSGNIPSTMSAMTALDSLNLSYNNLFGRIPSGNQLQTFTNDSYIGNPKLCGFPVSQSCDRNKTSNVEVPVDEATESDYWYVSIALGFVLGGWIVWGTFLMKKKWKKAWFRYIDYVYDAMYVFIAVNINRFKRSTCNETTLD